MNRTSGMKVLVTGANGLLGSHVVRVLIQHGFPVRVLVREGSNLQALDGLQIELFKGNISSAENVERAVKGCDFIVHAAARTSQSPSGIVAYIEPNILSTQLIINAARKFGIKRLVYVSTANCFGNGSKKHPGDEEKPFLSWMKKSGYAYSKYQAQQMVLKSAEKDNLDVVVVNPTFLIGENDVKPSSGKIFFHVVNKRAIFYPPGGKNFVDAAVAAEGVVNALIKGRKGECYLLAGQDLSYREFFEKVAKITGQTSVFLPLPRWVIITLGYFGSFIEKVFKIPVDLTKVNARMLCMENYYSSEKAVREIDFQQIQVEESIEKAILWFRNNNYFEK